MTLNFIDYLTALILLVSGKYNISIILSQTSYSFLYSSLLRRIILLDILVKFLSYLSSL